MRTKSVIIDAVRSPIGVKNGQLVGMRPDDLTAQVIKGLLARNEKVKPEENAKIKIAHRNAVDPYTNKRR